MEIMYIVMKSNVIEDETIAILRDKSFAIELCKAIESSYALLSDNGYKTTIYSNIDLPF